MQLRSLVAAVALALVALNVAPTAHAAEAPQRISRCGQAITGSIAYLDRDLTCANGFSLPHLTDGQGVVFDLRGHRLRGPGTGTAFTLSHDDFASSLGTVKNGRVEHWDTAFSAIFSSLTLTKVQITDNRIGVYCGGGNCAVSDSILRGNRFGTTMNEAAFAFTGNVFVGNGIGSRASGPNITFSTFVKNAFTRNDVGVSVAGGVSYAELTKNVFTGNRVGVEAGPFSEFGFRGFQATLVENLFVANRDGVHLELDADETEDASFTGNVALRNTRYGFYAPGAADLGHNRAAGNGKGCVGVLCGRP